MPNAIEVGLKGRGTRQESKDEPDTNEIIVEALGEEMKLLAKLHGAGVEVEATETRAHSYRDAYLVPRSFRPPRTLRSALEP